MKWCVRHVLFVQMDRIIKHIERLLLQHDCVIIPDFGGFVLQSASAVYLDDEHSFTPARKEIIFNPTLTHNDGLLVESYMQEYSVDFEKAQQWTRKDVASMKSTLNENSELQLGKIGFFVKESERLLFMPAKSSDVLFSTRSYGLPVFHYLPLSARIPVMVAPTVVTSGVNTETREDKNERHGKNIIYYIPVNRTFLRAMAVAAAAILLFLFISTPVSDVNNAAYTASFVPHEMMVKKSAENIATDASSTSEYVSATSSDEYVAIAGKTGVLNFKPIEGEIVSVYKEPAISKVKTGSKSKTNASKSSSSKSSSAKPASEKSTPAKSSSATSSSAKSPASKSSSTKTASAIAKPSKPKTGGGKYYVIIGSYKNRSDAQAHIKSLKGSKVSATADIIVRDRARVYAQSFSSENEAQSYMEQLHKNPKHKDAWIYIDK